MKQANIKEGRYYRSRRYQAVRFVDHLDYEDGVWLVRWKKPGEEQVLFAEKEVPLSKFARWAGQEVVPGFVPVRRCPDCDNLLDWDECSNLSVCEHCKVLRTE